MGQQIHARTHTQTNGWLMGKETSKHQHATRTDIVRMWWQVLNLASLLLPATIHIQNTYIARCVYGGWFGCFVCCASAAGSSRLTDTQWTGCERGRKGKCSRIANLKHIFFWFLINIHLDNSWIRFGNQHELNYKSNGKRRTERETETKIERDEMFLLFIGVWFMYRFKHRHHHIKCD